MNSSNFQPLSSFHFYFFLYKFSTFLSYKQKTTSKFFQETIKNESKYLTITASSFLSL